MTMFDLGLDIDFDFDIEPNFLDINAVIRKNEKKSE